MLYSISMRDARYAGRIKASYHSYQMSIMTGLAGWGEGKEKKKGKGSWPPHGLFLRTLSSSSTWSVGSSSSARCGPASFEVSIGARAFDIFKMDDALCYNSPAPTGDNMVNIMQ